MSPIPIIVQLYLFTIAPSAFATTLEILDPRPQLDLPGPGATRLAMQREIGLGDRVGVEQSVGTALVGARIGFFGDAAIDDDVADMDVLWLQLAGEALGQAAQRELAHRERG